MLAFVGDLWLWQEEGEGRGGGAARGGRLSIALPRDGQHIAGIIKEGNVQCLHSLFGRYLKLCGKLIISKIINKCIACTIRTRISYK